MATKRTVDYMEGYSHAFRDAIRMAKDLQEELDRPVNINDLIVLFREVQRESAPAKKIG